MSDFSVNTDFETLRFSNTISDFDKVFNDTTKKTTQETKADLEFEKIFNSMNPNALSANVSIDVNNTKNISPVEKTVNDIGNGFVNSLNDLNNIQRQSEKDFETFASGGDISVHDVMISTQKSNLSMQMAIQLRNRIINAYNDFKNMGV